MSSIYPCWLKWQRICLQCRRPRFDPWVRKIPWRREWLPMSVFLSGDSHWQRSLMGYSPWGGKELNTTELLAYIRPVSCACFKTRIRSISLEASCSLFCQKKLSMKYKMLMMEYVQRHRIWMWSAMGVPVRLPRRAECRVLPRITELSKWNWSVFPDTEVTLAKNGKLELSTPCESRVLLPGTEYEVKTGKRADELVHTGSG